MAKDAWSKARFAQAWDAANAARDNPDRENQLDLLVALLEGALGPDEGWILDLGAGSGQVEALIFERISHARVVCLDSSQEMLKLASERLRAHAGRYELLSGDMNDLEAVRFPHAPYAAVFSSQALHEIPHEKKRALFRKVFELLRPGGAFYILDRIEARFGDLSGEYERQWNRLNQREENPGDEAPMTFEEYRARYGAKEDYPLRLDEQLGWLAEAGFAAAPLYLCFNRALIAARRKGG